MVRYSKIFFAFIITLLLLWLLPWFYHFITAKPGGTPFTLYSCVVNDFAYLDFSEAKGVQYKTRNGQVYTDRQFDSILPLFYYRQLMSDGRLPDTLNGVKLSPQKIGLSNFIFRLSASDLNKKTPPLYPLLESMSGRVDLKMPDDVFRMTDRIEFIDMETNTINETKSELFTKTMKTKGFHYPMHTIGGNPTLRKDYDEGWFLTDTLDQLFHLKQLRGRPYFRPVTLPEGLKIRHIFVKEYQNRKFYAFLSDQESNLWVLSNPDYRLHRLPIGRYNPLTDNIQIVGDLFNWTISIDKPDGEYIYAIHADDYSLCDTLTYPAGESLATTIGRYFFPCELIFTSYDDQYVYPRFRAFSAKALWLPVLIVLFLIKGFYPKK